MGKLAQQTALADGVALVIVFFCPQVISSCQDWIAQHAGGITVINFIVIMHGIYILVYVHALV